MNRHHDSRYVAVGAALLTLGWTMARSDPVARPSEGNPAIGKGGIAELSTCCQRDSACRCGPAGDACCCTAAQEKQKKKEMMKASAEAMAKGAAARKAMEAHRKILDNEGVHSCCIKPSCVFCASAADMCPCAMNLRKGMPVCPECWGGWQAGYGRLQGIDPAKVQIIPKDKLKMMYEMKAKNFQKTEQSGK